MTKYVVTYCENTMNGRAYPLIVGVFTDEVKASNALAEVFLKACDTYCVDKELADETQCDTENSFYNEGKEFNIDYLRYGEVEGEVFGEIQEIEEDTMYMDTTIEEEDMTKEEKVKSLAEDWLDMYESRTEDDCTCLKKAKELCNTILNT